MVGHLKGKAAVICTDEEEMALVSWGDTGFVIGNEGDLDRITVLVPMVEEAGTFGGESGFAHFSCDGLDGASAAGCPLGGKKFEKFQNIASSLLSHWMISRWMRSVADRRR